MVPQPVGESAGGLPPIEGAVRALDRKTESMHSGGPVKGGPRRDAVRVLVAGMGSVLHGDDGFGVVVAQAMAQRVDLPAGVRVIEVGIGGISLVQELQAGYEALILLDAIDRGGAPGTVYVLEPQIPDPAVFSREERQALAVDMHWTNPSRVLILAKALDALPDRVYLVGCQPADAASLRLELSEPVAAAVGEATAAVEELLQGLGVAIEGRDNGSSLAQEKVQRSGISGGE